MGLIDYIVKKSYHQEFNTISTEREGDNIDSKYVSKHFYNLLTEADSNPHIKAYKEIANELIRFYSANAWSVPDMENTNITGKCFGNLQVDGQRTYPHYHHGFDGVLIYYLTAGNEFGVDDNNKLCYLPEDQKKYEDTNTDYNPRPGHDFANGQILDGSGNLILNDPRPAINYPYCNKAIAWHPVTGTLLLHPACIWHESNSFTGGGIRVSIVINYRILTESNSETVKPLATIYDEDN